MYTSPLTGAPGAAPQDDSYERARHRVGQIRGFYSNLFSYVVIIGFLAVINVLTYPGYLWFLYPAAGWGVGIAFHAYGTFARRGIFGRQWEERKIRELMERERSERASGERA